MIAGSRFLLPRYGPVVFVAFTLVLSALLIGVCLKTGEPPRWRWGD
jgi:hypothetical protein